MNSGILNTYLDDVGISTGNLKIWYSGFEGKSNTSSTPKSGIVYNILHHDGTKRADSETYNAYGPTWANTSNTPFRKFKHWVNEGGISTPLIVQWPSRINAKDGIRHQPSHLIDIMATCVDVAGATYPSEYKGNVIIPMEGKSLLPVFLNNEMINRDAIFF